MALFRDTPSPLGQVVGGMGAGLVKRGGEWSVVQVDGGGGISHLSLGEDWSPG